jgi:hypothetical protein
VFTAAAIMSVTGALVSLLRGKQFYYDDSAAGPAVTVTPAPSSKTIIPNGHALSSRNGDSAPVAGQDPEAPARRGSSR